MIQITHDLAIPETEVTFTASRSSGPGGQNVNKVSSRVTLSFNIADSSALSDDQKRRLSTSLHGRINKDGILRIMSQRTRSQEMNRLDALERFSELLRRALSPRRPRIRTRISASAQQRRIEEKKKRGETKQGRSGKGWDS